jgi:hypothetical protein
VTCTVDPANRPLSTPRSAAPPPPLGEVGDPPPQAEISVAKVAQEATWQASVQNCRRETVVVVCDMRGDPCVKTGDAVGGPEGQEQGHASTTRFY